MRDSARTALITTDPITLANILALNAALARRNDPDLGVALILKREPPLNIIHSSRSNRKQSLNGSLFSFTDGNSNRNFQESLIFRIIIFELLIAP